MSKSKTLREARDVLLKLHKTMLDMEREMYEGIHGQLTATEFLTLLLEDEDFAWLRKFSMLIVEIDEMFALKDGISDEMIDANLIKVRELVDMKDPDEYFRAKYQFAIQRNSEAAGLHAQIRQVMERENG